MSINGYFLRGIKDDNILVFRAEDSEELLIIIRRLSASRDKKLRALAKKLEIDFNNLTNKGK